MATDTIARAMAGNAKRLLDEYKNNPDVADIVSDKAALDAYDTSKLSESDIVKVLDDESRNHMETYYKWVNNDWDYIGGLGPYYTQTEINNLLLEKLAANQVATIQQDTTASKAYSIGDLLIYNGVLYQVTTDIASGATITVGTNVAATIIEEVIKNGQKQADWNQNDSNAKDYIKNKPIIPAEQIQSNWAQTNTSAKDYIKNKPTIPSAVTANPTLSGSERNLNGLQVGNVKYKVDNAPKIHDAGYSNEWENVTWVGMSAGALRTFQGMHIWTDGENIYWSNQTYHYILTRGTKTWSTKKWYGLTNFTGSEIWTDGENIYCSQGSSHYVLNKATSTWSIKTWNGLTNFYGSDIWVDGENIYHSRSSKQYVLNKNTSTWETKTWNNFNPPYGSYIWTDGENMYYSKEGSNYILNRETSTWSTKTWNGFSYINGYAIWTDGYNIYYDNQANDYVLNKTNSTWSKKAWIGNVDGASVWKDGDNIYCSLNDTTQIQLQEGYHKPEYIEKVAETGSYNDLKNKPDFQEKLISGTNIKTVNNESILGNGNLSINNFIEGYYYNNKFYSDYLHTQEIIPQQYKFYIDLSSNGTLYKYKNRYITVSEDIYIYSIYTEDTSGELSLNDFDGLLGAKHAVFKLEWDGTTDYYIRTAIEDHDDYTTADFFSPTVRVFNNKLKQYYVHLDTEDMTWECRTTEYSLSPSLPTYYIHDIQINYNVNSTVKGQIYITLRNTKSSAYTDLSNLISSVFTSTNIWVPASGYFNGSDYYAIIARVGISPFNELSLSVTKIKNDFSNIYWDGAENIAYTSFTLIRDKVRQD